MKERHNAKFWLLMTALAIVGGSALVATQFSRVKTDRARVDELRKQTQDEEVVQGALARSQKELQDARAKLTHLESNVPTTAYVPTMLFELEKTGKASGIKVTGVRPMPKPPVSNVAQQAQGEAEIARPVYEELNIEVKGRGTYGSVQRFVNALRAFPKIVATRTLTVSPTMDPLSAERGELEVVVELRAYLFPQAPAEDEKAKKEVASA